MSCASERAVEVYLEPVLPTPAVDTLASLTRELGWRPTVVDDGGPGADYPAGIPLRASLDLGALGIDGNVSIVVATQGHSRRAGATGDARHRCRHVGLIASREAERERVRPAARPGRHRGGTGAGPRAGRLDLGSVANEEIAVAVLAELVSLHATGVFRPSASRPTRTPVEAVDPVCGITVDVASAYHWHQHEGVTYYFCAAGCQQRFADDPAGYLS
jgi:xanthine dehydrogenase accessory factor